MNRTQYIANDFLALVEYCIDQDVKAEYDCWQDPDTQKGYTFQMDMDYEKFKNRPVRSRFRAVIQRKEDNHQLVSANCTPRQRINSLLHPPQNPRLAPRERRGPGGVLRGGRLEGGPPEERFPKCTERLHGQRLP